MPDNDPKDYGRWSISGAELISTPAINDKGEVDFFAAPPTGLGAPGAGGDARREVLRKRFMSDDKPAAPVAKRARPSPPPAPFSSVAVMEVGQGNCNLLIDSQNIPVLYYDTGFPIWWYTASAPATLRRDAAPPPAVGPITPQGGRKMGVVLSHWDWDHWRLARIWEGLTGPDIPWLTAVQPVGPSSLNFFNHVLGNNCTVLRPDAPRTMARESYTIYRAQPSPGMEAAAVMNNTGLALKVEVAPLPNPPDPGTVQPQWCVALTGDANFDSLPDPFPGATDLIGIAAVHHGSNRHGASENLPPPAIPGQGRVAYSYGRFPNGYHPYGFPKPDAVARYRAKGWGPPRERGTPEGERLNIGPPPNGNIRFGSQVDLQPPYSNTAFSTFPAAMRLT